MKKSIVWQLLRRNISVAQLAGYAIANLVGLAIVLTAVQFYRDVTEVWNSEDSFISRDYSNSGAAACPRPSSSKLSPTSFST